MRGAAFPTLSCTCDRKACLDGRFMLLSFLCERSARLRSFYPLLCLGRVARLVVLGLERLTDDEEAPDGRSDDKHAKQHDEHYLPDGQVVTDDFAVHGVGVDHRVEHVLHALTQHH